MTSNVIWPQFGKRPATSIAEVGDRKSVTEEPTATSAARIISDAIYFVKNGDRFSTTMNTVETITDYISDLLSFVDNTSVIPPHRDDIEKTPFELLCIYLDTSTQEDWAKNPFFYSTVIIEIENRMLQISQTLFGTDIMECEPKEALARLEVLSDIIEAHSA